MPEYTYTQAMALAVTVAAATDDPYVMFLCGRLDGLVLAGEPTNSPIFESTYRYLFQQLAGQAEEVA